MPTTTVNDIHNLEIENELVTRLDSLYMSDSKGDDISRGFFIELLWHLFDISDVEEQLRFQVSNFLDSSLFGTPIECTRSV